MTDTATPPAEGPAHYRLSTRTWEMILKEYREGATAPFLTRKWRVSEHALRARITRHGATKRDWGDAQAIHQAVAREAELEEARRNSPEAVAARLFDGVGTVPVEQGLDPAFLAKVAILASGRAMTGRLWVEAKALAGLAESYARLDQKTNSAPPGVDQLALQTLFDIVTMQDKSLFMRFGVDPDDYSDPDRPLKDRFWRWYHLNRQIREATAQAARQ